MKTSFDIVDKLYDVINTSAVNAQIDGQIYKHNKPVNSVAQDIVILSLTNNDDDIQDGYFIINCYCSKIVPMLTVNKQALDIIVKSVTKELESYSQSDSNYFDFDIISENLFEDDVQKDMNYVSIRLRCYIDRRI